MSNSLIISQILGQSEVLQNLDPPVMFTGGQLSPNKLITANVLNDDGQWERYSHTAPLLYQHAVDCLKHPPFRKLIDLLITEVKPKLKSAPHVAISGGMRCDILFAGPVAHLLNLDLIAMYKDGQRVELITPNKEIIRQPNLQHSYVVQISDVNNAGTSQYRVENNQAQGWIPTLARSGAELKDIFFVMSRSPANTLANLGYNTHVITPYNSTFIHQYSKNPAEDTTHHENPDIWTRDYLAKHGALKFVHYFTQPRAKRFLERYGSTLRDFGHWEPLKDAVQKELNISLEKIIK
jgi:hypothetical protein